MIASVASVVLGAALGLAGIWNRTGYNVGGALLVLLSALLEYRA